MNYTEEECKYWYNYIFGCLSTGFTSFATFPHRVINPFVGLTEYKPLRKKEKAAKYVLDLTNEYLHKWISCEDRLPDEGIRVLIHLSNGWMQVAFRQDDEWILLCDEYHPIKENDYKKIVAWTPLPEYMEGN